jgi:hypothetical protein
MSDERKRPTPERADQKPPAPAPHEDEGADGLGYTARPTDHEPEGHRAPAGGGDDAPRQ